VREQAREMAREKEMERAREKAREKARQEEMEEGKKVKMKRAMTHRMAVIFGASQPTLALGRQTSNCHVGQDYAGRLSTWLTGPKSGGKSGARLGRECGTPSGTAPGLLNSSGALSGRIPGTSFTGGLDGTSS
jgi:hypothetical protein